VAPTTKLVWSPRWCSHVVGVYPPREPNGEGGFDEQRIELTCSLCNDAIVAYCSTGNVKRKIANYASIHLHREGR
jgi:hypothetical protein